jgi:hypothetical protein
MAAVAAAPAQQMMKPNKEGEDLDPPMPVSWTLDKLKSGALPVRIFGDLPSPSNFRLRYMLSFYEIPFTISEGGYAKNVDKAWEYKKMPVLRIGAVDDVAEAYKTGDPEKGRIINDGFVVIKSLAPMVQGRALSDEEMNIEKYFSFGLQYNMLFGAGKAGKINGGKLKQQIPNKNCCTVCCAQCCLGCCCPYCICPCCCNYVCCGGGKIEGMLKGMAAGFKVDYAQLKTESFVENGKKLGGLLNGREYFCTDGKLGLVDVDLFGYIHYQVSHLKNPYAAAMINADPKLKAWYDRMKGDAPGQIDAFANLKFVAPKS